MKKLTTEEFIEKANLTHNNKYSYESSIYINTRTNITITCPIHGEFKQLPNNHIRGQRCPKCFGNKTKTTEEFIEEAKSLHNNFYDYSLTTYKNNKTKVTINCFKHGIFEQSPNSHLSGKGCPKCGAIKTNNVWSHSGWEQAGKQSKQFKGFSIYIIQCWNEKEQFIKIGKTYTGINKRFNLLPYEFKVVKQHYGSGKYISELEDQLKKKYKEHSYTPINSFGGMYECFSLNILKDAICSLQPQ